MNQSIPQVSPRLAARDLIFIISQPRSGSTLLQHVLGSHPEVHTLPESWLLLPLVYALRPNGATAEYDARLAAHALSEFLQHVPGGDEAYWSAARELVLALYGRALDGSGKHRFIDKTPRYYFIVPELRRMFPEASIVLLIRNPLAVLSSLVETNLRGNWYALADLARQHDLLTAPRRIVTAMETLGEAVHVVHYEQLVTAPEPCIALLCERLGLTFTPAMLAYGDKVRFEGAGFVDPKSIYRHHAPVAAYAEEWVARYDSPLKVRIGQQYLDALGPDTLTRLGYDIDELRASLARPRAAWAGLSGLRTISHEPENPAWWQRARGKLAHSIATRGLRGTLERLIAGTARAAGRETE